LLRPKIKIMTITFFTQTPLISHYILAGLPWK
jgi:hypothetical protein